MDQAPTIKVLVWALVLGKWGCELGLEWLNRRHVLAHANGMPEALKSVVDEPTYARSREYTLADVETYLAAELKKDPQLGVWLRADKKEEFGRAVEVMDVVRRLGIGKFDIATSPPKR